MQKFLFYTILFSVLWGCKSKHNTVINQPPAEEDNTVNIESQVTDKITSYLSHNTDSVIAKYYRQNNYMPFWLKDSLYTKGITWIKNSRFHGLNPTDYKLKGLDSLLLILQKDTNNIADTYSKLDIMLSGAIKECSKDIRISKLNPVNYYDGWNYQAIQWQTPQAFPLDLIRTKGFHVLDSLYEPKNKLYKILREELIVVEGKTDLYDKPIHDPGFTLHPGDSNKYILPVKHQLLNIPEDSLVSMKYDKELQKAVTDLQRKHGLTTDGIIGENTYTYINWNKVNYINSIKVNLERLRWLPDTVFENGIIINIANQSLQLIINNKLIFKSNTIVGKYKNKTPVFTSKLDYVVFNPCWTVPNSIASTAVLKGMQKDTLYLQKRNMFACINGKEIATKDLHPENYTPDTFPYTIFQRADDNNALGQVKFMFANRYSIYLHDTPSKSLFQKSVRTFSHGCVRIQNALDLSEIILKNDNNPKSKESYLAKGFPVKVYLKNKIPLSLIYLTCHYDSIQKTIIYDKDVYLQDYTVTKDLK